MGSNTEKKPWTNLQNKNWSKGIKSNNFAIAKLEERWLKGSNREKINIAWRIWTYPISPLNYTLKDSSVRNALNAGVIIIKFQE